MCYENIYYKLFKKSKDFDGRKNAQKFLIATDENFSSVGVWMFDRASCATSWPRCTRTKDCSCRLHDYVSSSVQRQEVVRASTLW